MPIHMSIPMSILMPTRMPTCMSGHIPAHILSHDHVKQVHKSRHGHIPPKFVSIRWPVIDVHLAIDLEPDA